MRLPALSGFTSLARPRRESIDNRIGLSKTNPYNDKKKKEKLDDVLVLVGGIIPDQDIPKLKDLGVSEVFQPGVSTKDIIEYVRRNVGKR